MLFLSIVLLAIFQGLVGLKCDQYDYVDPIIGSSGKGFGYGSVSPAAQLPYGSMRAGIDTTTTKLDVDWEHFSGFYVDDTHVRGFSHTRLVGAGASDFGNIGITPFCDSNTKIPSDWDPLDETIWWDRFLLDRFKAKPGYQQVLFPSCGVNVQVTATGLQSALYRISSLPTASKNPSLVLDVCHAVTEASRTKGSCKEASLTIDPQTNIIEGSVLYGNSLSGRSKKGGVWIYFSLSFRDERNEVSSSVFPSTWRPWTAEGLLFENGSSEPWATEGETGGLLGSFLDMPSSDYSLAIGISFLSIEQARENLKEQVPSLPFPLVLQETETTWCSSLSTLRLDASSSLEKQIQVHSAHYRTLLSPTIYSEGSSSRSYPSMDGQQHDLSWNGYYMSDLSLWDTHRTRAGWDLLHRRDVASDILHSLERMQVEGGSLPKWPLADVYTGCMIGNAANSFILESLLKGLNFPEELESMYLNMKEQALFANASSGSRKGADEYWDIGYVSSETADNAASLTVTYAFDDACIAGIASLLGYEEDKQLFEASSKKYTSLWSSEHLLICPRSKETNELSCPPSNDSPLAFQAYTEGSAWQWTYFVPHDIAGLASLFNAEAQEGEDVFAHQLESFFNLSVPFHEKWGNFIANPYYWAGNEPDLLVPYFFSFSSKPELTRSWTRSLIDTYFPNSPEGLPGNDDYGTLSAWLLLSCSGIYPISGSSTYVITAPCVSGMELDIMERGEKGSVEKTGTLSILTKGFDEDKTELEKVILNGNIEVDIMSSPFIDHEDLFSVTSPTIEFWFE